MPGEYDIKIDDTVTPVIHPPRSVPAALTECERVTGAPGKVRHHFQISKRTQWVNSMVVVRKKNGREEFALTREISMKLY